MGRRDALIFYTAGEAVRHVVPGHVPYAEVNGLWQGRTISPFRAALDAAWKPYLSGRGTRAEAISRLVEQLPRTSVGAGLQTTAFSR